MKQGAGMENLRILTQENFTPGRYTVTEATADYLKAIASASAARN